MKKNIFDIITEYATNEGLDNILLQDAEYMEIQDKIEAQRMQFDKLNLAKEQCLIVDRLIPMHMESRLLQMSRAVFVGADWFLDNIYSLSF